MLMMQVSRLRMDPWITACFDARRLPRYFANLDARHVHVHQLDDSYLSKGNR